MVYSKQKMTNLITSLKAHLQSWVVQKYSQEIALFQDYLTPWGERALFLKQISE